MMFHPVYKKMIAAGICCCLTGCGSSVTMLGNSEWQSQKDGKAGRNATVFVANTDFTCKIVSSTPDKLIVRQNGTNSELPMEVVSKIEFKLPGKSGHPVLGSVIGGAVGVGAGYALGHAASSSKGVGAALFHPLSLVCILGGAVTGGLIASGSEKSEEFSFDKTLKPFVLHPEVGLEITPLEIRAFSLFGDLESDTDEKVLQVQIFQLSSGAFFLLYDVSASGAYQVKWRVAEESYINAERTKIKRK